MSQASDFPITLQIESCGRFGNYFYVEGLMSRVPLETQRIEYILPSPAGIAHAEVAFYLPTASSNDETLPGHHFLHLFWVNDGYITQIDAYNPVQMRIPASDEDGSDSVVSFHEMDGSAVPLFIEALARTASSHSWNNRLTMEIVARFDLGDQYTFFRVYADTCGWMEAHTSLLIHNQSLKRQAACHLSILFYADWAEVVTDAIYMPPNLKDGFMFAVDAFDCTNLYFDSAVKAVTQLARFDLPTACRFACEIILAHKPQRENLAKLLMPCLPPHSQWWIHSVLGNQYLGVEQVADALNVAGHAAECQIQDDLARLCYQTAIILSPKSQSVAWNLGWLCARTGDLKSANQSFARISRHFPKQSLCTAWPVVSGSIWPSLPQKADCVRLPEGNRSWPRISIITPSYNQGSYIEETILSILNQNYPNLQYIVIDGNSTDDTRDVLERYRDRIDHLVIESDNGQTEAINKGLRVADGEIIAWLNSDDVYAPGALHAVALAWLKNHADVIAGQCLEHMDHRFLLINKPAARDSEFNLPQLARIFKYWLKGHYFYQPEVFFSKRILDKVGLLDESLYYSMDYDLWMRFANAGARLEVIDWPVAFFRKHDSQKTSNLIDCIEEQSRVRTSHYKLGPDDERRCRILRSISSLSNEKKITVGILTKRLAKIFSESTQKELDTYIDGKYRCVFGDSEYDPAIAQADIVIHLVHVLDDLHIVSALRNALPGRPIIGWFWDNHHHLFENHAVAEVLDIVIPGHALYSEYLRSDKSILGQHVPLCVTQWTRQDATEWFQKYNADSRKTDLYGGFVDYHFEPARTRFLCSVMEQLPNHALSILCEDNLKTYFGRGEEERFAEWCQYQTSLVLPLRNDLSQRVFDALLAGQIPLVPEQIQDLDLVISKELQESLPILRFSMKNPKSCLEAYNKATEHAKREGASGRIRRHQYAVENHMFSSMIQRIITATIEENHIS